MAESLMHRIDFSVSWKRKDGDSDSLPNRDSELRFDLKIDKGEPYKETEKQFMLGEGKSKSRVLKTNYMIPEQWYSGDKPDWSHYYMYAKSEELLAAKLAAKRFMQTKYETFLQDSQTGLASIVAYDPESL